MSLCAVAVVGAGPKGLSIAEAAAEADLPVTVVCMTGARRRLALTRVTRTLSMRVDIGELTREESAAILSRIRFTRDLSEVAGCDLVIESAVGDVRMRRAVLATVESRVSCGSVLASDIEPSELANMAEVLVRKDQFLGLRFFHPATHTPLVEVSPLPDTAPGALAAVQTFCRWLGKTPVEHVSVEAQPLPARGKQALG